jgi:hypothetical protein
VSAPPQYRCVRARQIEAADAPANLPCISGPGRDGQPLANGLIATLRHPYEGDSPEAHRFRYSLVVFDVVAILFIILTSFLPRSDARMNAIGWLDIAVGLVVLDHRAEKCTRFSFVQRCSSH